MNRPCRHALLTPLLAVVALLLGLTESASAAFNNASTEPHYGNFLLWESEASGFSAYEIADPIKENGQWIYDSTLGVPVYVNQNPWTFFDPLGLEIRRGEGWEDDDWEYLRQEVEDSGYLEGNRYESVANDPDHVIYVDRIDQSARETRSRYEATGSEERLEKRKKEGREDAYGVVFLNPEVESRMRPGPDGKLEGMSAASVLVHEVAHAFDHIETPQAFAGAEGYLDHALRDFFAQDPQVMHLFPNRLEQNAVDEANLFRSKVNETSRTAYSSPPGKLLETHGVSSHQFSPSVNFSDKRYKAFQRGKERWNAQNPENKFSHRGFTTHGNWPIKK